MVEGHNNAHDNFDAKELNQQQSESAENANTRMLAEVQDTLRAGDNSVGKLGASSDLQGLQECCGRIANRSAEIARLPQEYQTALLDQFQEFADNLNKLMKVQSPDFKLSSDPVDGKNVNQLMATMAQIAKGNAG